MGPSQKVGIYVAYETASIIRYLEPTTENLHTACFADCIFDENNFLSLGGGNIPLDEKCRKIIWQTEGIAAYDPRTSEANGEVQKIIDLQKLANNLPDHFCHLKSVTKSHVPTRNAPERVEVPKEGTPHLVLGASKTNKMIRNSIPRVPNSRRLLVKVRNESLP